MKTNCSLKAATGIGERFNVITEIVKKGYNTFMKF